MVCTTKVVVCHDEGRNTEGCGVSGGAIEEKEVYESGGRDRKGKQKVVEVDEEELE